MNQFTVIDKSFKQQFSQFLLNKDLLQLILAVYLGSVLQKFLDSFVNGLILPLMILFVPNSQYTNFDDITVKFLGVDIEAGKLTMSLINLFLGFLISYIFVYYVINYLKN